MTSQSPIIPPDSSVQHTQVQPSSADPTTAGNIAASTPKEGSYDKATKLTSLKDLQEKAPQLWKAMLQGIAQHIIHEMRESTERMREMFRKARQGR